MLTQGTWPGNVAVAAGWSPGLALVTGLQVPAEPAVGLRCRDLPARTRYTSWQTGISKL